MVKPLLNEVYLRMGWAGEHIATLKEMQRSIEEIDPETVTVNGEVEFNTLPNGNRKIITPWFDMAGAHL